MTGFAIVGPNFQLGAEDGTAEGKATFQAYQTLSLILMTSRLILACQYGAAYMWLVKYKKAHVPLLAHIGTLFVAAMIYLGLFFSFRNNIGETGLIAWYVTIGFEAVVILLVSGRTKFLSFRKTAIVERLGLLTLIILGEGIIGLCNSVSKVGSDGVFTSDVIGMIISSVTIICMLLPPLARVFLLILIQILYGCFTLIKKRQTMWVLCAKWHGQSFTSHST